LSTQSAYQYARRHADEIVAAGCQLAEYCREAHVDEIPLDDPGVPRAFRELGVRRIQIREEHVHVYVPGLPGFADREFIIDRIPDPARKGTPCGSRERAKGVGSARSTTGSG